MYTEGNRTHLSSVIVCRNSRFQLAEFYYSVCPSLTFTFITLFVLQLCFFTHSWSPEDESSWLWRITLCLQQVKILLYSVKYLKFCCAVWSTMLYRYSCSPEEGSLRFLWSSLRFWLLLRLSSDIHVPPFSLNTELKSIWQRQNWIRPNTTKLYNRTLCLQLISES